MNFIDLVLILLIFTVFYLIYKGSMNDNNNNKVVRPPVTNKINNINNINNSNNDNNNIENFDGKAADENYIYDDTVNDEVKAKRRIGIDDLDIEFDNPKQYKKKRSDKADAIKLKSNFLDMQFHTDYRDTLSSVNEIAPDQKQIFNIANAPTRLTTPNPKSSEVKKLVQDFINLLNRNSKYNVSDYRGSNTGWDEPLVQLKEKSGFESYMEELGLPTSLFSDPAKRAPLKLVKIDYVEKYVTEFETQYIIILIMQKVNVSDQMIVRVSFVRENNNIDDERKFFDDIDCDYLKNNYTNGPKLVNSKVSDPEFNEMVIEEIFIVGFLTNVGMEGEKAVNYDKLDFYEFKGLETNDIVDQHTIVKELMQKRLQQQKEMQSFTSSLSSEGQQFHSELPSPYGYKSYACTRTVIDDLNNSPMVYD